MERVKIKISPSKIIQYYHQSLLSHDRLEKLTLYNHRFEPLRFKCPPPPLILFNLLLFTIYYLMVIISTMSSTALSIIKLKLSFTSPTNIESLIHFKTEYEIEKKRM